MLFASSFFFLMSWTFSLHNNAIGNELCHVGESVKVHVLDDVTLRPHSKVEEKLLLLLFLPGGTPSWQLPEVRTLCTVPQAVSGRCAHTGDNKYPTELIRKRNFH